MSYLPKFLQDNPDINEDDFINAVKGSDPSAFQVNESNSTLKGLSPAPEVTDSSNFQLEPWDFNKAPDVTGSMSLPSSDATPTPVTVPNPAVEQPKAGQENTKETSSTPLDALKAPQSPDNAARQAFLEQERKKHLLGTIPVALGGISEALGNAAAPFGGKGSTGGAEEAEKTLATGEAQRKTAFEKGLMDDPSSQISQNYRNVVAKMMGTNPTDPQIKDMSAADIAQTLPEVEKYMAKELQVEAIKANKALARGMQEGNERDRLWNQGVQSINMARGEKPLLDSEVRRDSAKTAFDAIDNIQNEGRTPTQLEYYDLLGQLWKARNGSSVTNEELKKMDAQTLQSKIGPIATLFTGDPKAITTPANTQAIKNFVIQSGLSADNIHEDYMNSRGLNAAASRMSQWPEDQERLKKMGRGSSFAEYTHIDPTQWKAGAAARGGNSPQSGQTKTLGGKTYHQIGPGQWVEVQ